jgi:hypothetical protein
VRIRDARPEDAAGVAAAAHALYAALGLEQVSRRYLKEL